MSTEITTVITLAGGIIVAGATYMFTKWKEREAEWRREKREHYKDFVNALVDEIVQDASSNECRKRRARASNNLNLIAPQAVITALQAFHNELEKNCYNKDKDEQLHVKLLSKVFYEMRRDLNISPKDNPETFCIKLWSPSMPSNSK